MPASKPTTPASDVIAAMAGPEALLQLFEDLPGVYLFVKDREGRFVTANQSTLALHGCTHEDQWVGRTDFDFHPPALAAQYVEEDRAVMKSRKPLRNQVWLVMSFDGMPRWYLSSKIPLLGENGEPVGLAGVLRPYDHTGPSSGQYSRLTPAMEHVLAHFGDTIETSQLAQLANLSVSQFQREFRRLFRMSAGEYLLRVRLLIARRRLEETNDAVGQIALDCGFYDQSHFNRSFRAKMGIPPLTYRKQFRR